MSISSRNPLVSSAFKINSTHGWQILHQFNMRGNLFSGNDIPDKKINSSGCQALCLGCSFSVVGSVLIRTDACYGPLRQRTRHLSGVLHINLCTEGMSSIDRARAQAYWASMHTNFDVINCGVITESQLNELNELRDQAYENSLIYKEKTKRIHDAKIKNRVFNVGDRVLLFNSRLKIFSGKLKSVGSGTIQLSKFFLIRLRRVISTPGPNFKVEMVIYKTLLCEGDITNRVVHDLPNVPMDQLIAGTGTDNQEKDEKQSQNDKTRLGMEKTVKDKAKSTEKSTGQSQSQPKSTPGSQRYDVGEPDPKYVSLEYLTTLAMNKIEALSIERLRIQSGMSDKDAPSNISPQSNGEISALEGAKSVFQSIISSSAFLLLKDTKTWSKHYRYFPPTPGPAQYVSSDGSPFSSPGLSSDRIGHIWIFFKLRDLEEMQNRLTEFYLAFLKSLSSASICSAQNLIEADGSSNVCLSTAQPYVVGGLHELSRKKVSNAQRDLSDSGKRKVKAYIGSAAFQACSALCHGILCYVSDSGLMEWSMILSANRKMSAEAPRSCPCAALGALFNSLEALSSSEARGSVLDRLRCVLADSLTVALNGLYADEHFEVLCVQHRRLGSGREMRNLVSVTCSLTQSKLIGFIKEYDIALCYDPQLPSPEQTALDALKGYIPLYLSLFSIGNLRLPLNAFCLDVFGLRGEPSLDLFRSLYNIGPAGDWLTFQKRSGPAIPQISDNSMTNIQN
ncbi:reverse transcriptase domain-containing protein [Tanacetum coccineum]